MNINEEDEDQLPEKKNASRRNSLAKILAPQGKHSRDFTWPGISIGKVLSSSLLRNIRETLKILQARDLKLEEMP